MVDVEVPKAGPLIIQADISWRLQSGDRASAYKVMHRGVADYAREHNIARVVIKGSAVSLRRNLENRTGFALRFVFVLHPIPF